MNNRYTFKAKRKDNREWITGYYMYSPHDCKNYIFDGNNGYGLNDCREFEYYEIIPETLCQCTGLKDRDGKDIFENDVVKSKDYELVVVFTRGSYRLTNLKYSFMPYKSTPYGIDYGCLSFYRNQTSSFRQNSSDYWKIIGNKFDKEVE